MNIANLKLFRDGFQKLMDDGVVTQETFDMDSYRINKDGSSATFRSIHDCGTVGCFLGWAPFIKGLERTDAPGWSAYSYEKFRFPYGRNLEFDDVFQFLFASNWKFFDNTPEGALARLDVFLAGDFKYKDEDFLD